MDDLGVEHALLTILTVRKLILNDDDDGDEVNGDDGDEDGGDNDDDDGNEDANDDGGDDGDDDDGGYDGS